jgi:hypothetical protein
MAQTNYTPIQLYYSATTTNVPLAANMANGELAINIYDGKLFYKDYLGAIQVIATKANATSPLAVVDGGTGGSTASAARSNLSAAKSGANTDITSIALTTGTITTAPTTGNEITNKTYVDGLVSTGIAYHSPVQATTTGTLASITGGTVTYNNGTAGVGATLTLSVALTVLDGYTLANTNRILVKDEATQANNGVYTWATGGTVLTRATDADTYGPGVNQLSQNDYFFTQNGTVNKGNSYIVTTVGTITFGTTAITFSQFSTSQVYVAGTGLTLTGQTFSITSPISPALGGTGVVNNAASTIAISGNFASTFTITGVTAVTFPTTGTLATLTGTETFTNKTLTNPTVTNYVETRYAPAAGSAFTVDLANGTVQQFSLNANGTITLPSSVTGKSFVIIITYSGSYTLTWTGGSTIKWPSGTTPTSTNANGKYDIFTFFQDGTYTYGQSFGLNY